MQEFSNSELILNKDNSIYHLHLRPENIADTIFLVGDPERVPEVSKYFDKIIFQTQKREFVTHTGFIGSKKFSVISSGIGADNVEILMTELDALVNIDLETRSLKPTKEKLNFIRIGTSGALQANIPVDSFVVSKNAIGFDNLASFYDFRQYVAGTELLKKLVEHLSLNFQPYYAKASKILLEKFQDIPLSNTLTCPGFYVPQGREIRVKNSLEKYLEKIKDFEYQSFKIGNIEMETAAYYAFADLLGHNMISLNAILANRTLQTFSENSHQTIDILIRLALERFV